MKYRGRSIPDLLLTRIIITFDEEQLFSCACGCMLYVVHGMWLNLDKVRNKKRMLREKSIIQGCLEMCKVIIISDTSFNLYIKRRR